MTEPTPQIEVIQACPFCGYPKPVISKHDETLWWTIDCPDDDENPGCGASIIRSTKAAVVRAWNTRHRLAHSQPLPVSINPDALAALRDGQRQLDMEGIEVGVSRQALDEAIAALSVPALPVETDARARELLAAELGWSDRTECLSWIANAEHGDFNKAGCRVDIVPALRAITRALTNNRAVSLEGRAVDGPVAKDENGDWYAEVQTVGGHNLLATVYGETRGEALAAQQAVMGALASPIAQDRDVRLGLEMAARWHDARAKAYDEARTTRRAQAHRWSAEQLRALALSTPHRTHPATGGTAMTCPTCGSTAPHMHPAVQHEGEVEVCADSFHLTPTLSNRPAFIAAVEAKRARQPEGEKAE